VGLTTLYPPTEKGKYVVEEENGGAVVGTVDDDGHGGTSGYGCAT